MDNKKIRIIMGIIFGIVIIIMVILLVRNKDAFKQEITVEYPGGCVETYINGELVTPKCSSTGAYPQPIREEDIMWQYNGTTS